MAPPHKTIRGFSVIELLVAMAVALVLTGIGMPYFLNAYRSYQLTNAASQLAGILRLTRYEAIRRNTPVSCMWQAPDAASTIVWVDTIANQLPDPTEQTVYLGTGGRVIDPGTVQVGNLPAKANVTALNAQPANNAAIQFDQRGAVSSPAPVAVNVFYLSGVDASSGYRAVLLMPTGLIQVWTGDGAGNWQQLR